MWLRYKPFMRPGSSEAKDCPGAPRPRWRRRTTRACHPREQGDDGAVGFEAAFVAAEDVGDVAEALGVAVNFLLVETIDHCGFRGIDEFLVARFAGSGLALLSTDMATKRISECREYGRAPTGAFTRLQNYKFLNFSVSQFLNLLSPIPCHLSFSGPC